MTDLDKLEELERAATKGEWKVGAMLSSGGRAVWSDECATSILTTCTELNSQADAALIVALRNNAPAMVAELRTLREARNAFEQTTRDLMAERDGLNATLLAREDSQIMDRRHARENEAALRAEVEKLKAMNHELNEIAHDMTESTQSVHDEADTLRAEVEGLRERPRLATQRIIEAIGAIGPEDLDGALTRLLAELDELREDWNHYSGPCPHGRDPWTRCDESDDPAGGGCGNQSEPEAMRRALRHAEAQLATAQEDALEEAAKACEMSGAVAMKNRGECAEAFRCADAIRALKKTTKGGGA